MMPLWTKGPFAGGMGNAALPWGRCGRASPKRVVRDPPESGPLFGGVGQAGSLRPRKNGAAPRLESFGPRRAAESITSSGWCDARRNHSPIIRSPFWPFEAATASFRNFPFPRARTMPYDAGPHEHTKLTF